MEEDEKDRQLQRIRKEQTTKRKMLEKYRLDFFLYSPEDLPRVERHRRFLECKRQIIVLLSKKPMGLRELWFELDPYRDVREAVLAELRLEKVIKIRWFTNPLDEKGEYCLNKQKNRKNVNP